MNCHDLEERLELLLRGALPATEESACSRHLEGCEGCRELIELARRAGAAAEVAFEAGPDLVPAVLARTSGGACGRAQELLAESFDTLLGRTDQVLLHGHLTVCGECTALAGALRELARDLPRLADVVPDRRFVADVLRRTLPVATRLRRWWQRLWPQLVHRPRFAVEAAYFGLVVLVLAFQAPGSPLGTVPSRALALIRDPALPGIELPVLDLESRLEATARALREAKNARAATDLWVAGEEAVAGAARLAVRLRTKFGTFWDEAASLLERGDSESPQESATIEESS